MSFSSDVKSSIIDSLSNESSRKCCKRAFMLGVLSARGYVENNLVNIIIDGEGVLACAIGLITEQYGKVPTYTRKKNCKSRYTLTFSGNSAKNYISTLDSDNDINLSKICKCTYCRNAFLQGVFTASGKISDPENSFRLELDLLRTDKFSAFFEKADISLNKAKRNGNEYLYTKNANIIADFFALASENNTIFSVINKKLMNEMRVEANRYANCESRNIKKSVSVASEQVQIIEKLIETKRIQALSDDLIDTAIARLEHKELSLAQLAAIMLPPLTKSGLNHRLKKIVEEGKKLLSEKN